LFRFFISTDPHNFLLTNAIAARAALKKRDRQRRLRATLIQRGRFCYNFWTRYKCGAQSYDFTLRATRANTS
jgi:hypothetical protein